jgi:uncharacterized protein YecE (DUF72 family)
MELLERHGAGRVVMDVRPIRAGGEGGALLDDARERKPDVPMRPLRTRGPALVRYIGHVEPAENDVYLDEWAGRLAGWIGEGAEIYLFMHCPDESRAPALCRAIQNRLERLSLVPPLPWDRDEPPPAPPAQLRLF